MWRRMARRAAAAPPSPIAAAVWRRPLLRRSAEARQTPARRSATRPAAVGRRAEPAGGEGGDRLAHEGAADAKRGRELRLGRQPPAPGDAAAGDLGGEPLNHFGRALARRAERAEGGAVGGSA